MTPADLQRALHFVEPAAVLVSPRMMESIIRQADKSASLSWQVPHRKSFIVDRQTLFRHVDQEELALGPDQLLPQTVILLAWPESEELQKGNRAALLRKYWQRLFHASVHMALDDLWAKGKLTAAMIRERIDNLGPTTFAEIRSVLVQDNYLSPEADERAVYVEFVAVFLDLDYFSPQLLPIYFPTIRDLGEVKKLLTQDVEAQSLFLRTRLEGASEPSARPARSSEEAHEYYWKLVRGSDQAAQEGNVVRAAILRRRAARVAPPARASATLQAAVTQLMGLLDRLQKALNLPPNETEEWRIHLPALLDKADQGSHPVEAALLYDLQKVCLDHEQEIYSLDLVEWVLSGGKRPIQRPLPSQRLVRVTRTLRAAAPRLALARLADDDRNQFAVLLQTAVQRSEEKVRLEFRPKLTSALHDVGLEPRNPLEATAFAKVVEELLDRIIASGFVTFSELRDTLSRSALKLPDLTDPQDFIKGDNLLRLDRRLGTLLDGVYRPSEFYLRWLERFTAINFGTSLGRLLTMFVTVPFLGAFLVMECVSLGLLYFDRKLFIPVQYGATVLLGFFFLGLLHSAQVRDYCARLGEAVGPPLRAAFFDGPLWLWRHTELKEVVASWPFQLCYWYLVKPFVVAAVVFQLLPQVYQTAFGAGLVFLCAMFFINSRPGQAVGEGILQSFVHFVDLLRAGLIPGLFKLVVELFKQIMHWGEVLLFTVDEWLRFRGSDSRTAMVARAVLSMLWFPIAYFVRFNIVVLIEPCLNPLKLPIVSIATKLMIPVLPTINGWLFSVFEPVVGTVVGGVLSGWFTWWLPDVFGFIFWEMKENWSLYRSNRRAALGPVALGRHGETLRNLLQPGFHSGIVPRLFANLRYAERQSRRSGNFSRMRACQSSLAEVEQSVHLFVTREFCALLALTPAWTGPAPSVRRVSLATNQIRVELQLADHTEEPMCLELDCRSGQLVAGITAIGWLDKLPASQQILFYNSLAVLYKLGGIDVVCKRPRTVLPAVEEPIDTAATHILAFRDIPITWDQCVACWQPDEKETSPASLLNGQFSAVAEPKKLTFE